MPLTSFLPEFAVVLSSSPALLVNSRACEEHCHHTVKKVTPETPVKFCHLLYPQALEREPWRASQEPRGRSCEGVNSAKQVEGHGKCPFWGSGRSAKRHEESLWVCLDVTGSPSEADEKGNLGQGTKFVTLIHLLT